MNTQPDADPSHLFAAERRHLLGVAYRLLGTMTDAEDVLQDVFERWLATDRTTVANPAAYLTTMTTRASIDRLRSAQHRREVYVGPWLPEPVPTNGSDHSPEAMAELDESLTMGYLHLLEQLTPRERAAHLLHDVYDFSFREIASMIDREEAACRQLASRARSKLRANKPDQGRRTSREADDELCHRLVDAVTGGDITQVMSLLANGVVYIGDGGADHRAARQPILGAERVARLLVGLAGKLDEDDLAGLEIRYLHANEQSAVLLLVHDLPLTMLAIDSGAAGVERIYAMVNPDKLGAVSRRGSIPSEAGDPLTP